MILVALVFVLGYLGIFQNDFLSSFLIQIVVMFAVPMLMYTLFVSKNVGKTLKDTGFKRFSFKMFWISILLGVILYIINSFVANISALFINLLGYESLTSSTNTSFNYATLLKEFALTAILPGFCEEFLHRGIMLLSAKKRTNPKFCLIISSLLFGLVHMNIGQFFYAAILGALMGYVALCADSIYPSMIIHFMNNFLGTYFFYGYYMDLPFAKFIQNIETLLINNILGYVTVTTLIIMGLIYLYRILTRALIIERVKIDMKKVIAQLKLENAPAELAEEKLRQINYVLTHSPSSKLIFGSKNKARPTFKELIFVIPAIILGAFVTIGTFIWGIL